MKHRKTLHRAFRRKATGTALMVVPQPEEEAIPSFWPYGLYFAAYALLAVILEISRAKGLI